MKQGSHFFKFWIASYILSLSLGQQCQVRDQQVLPAPSTYYVSPYGSNDNPGTSNQPWRTIQYGVESLAPGDVLLVRGGNYHEMVSITKSGTEEAPITVGAFADEVPVIDGNNYLLPAGNWSALLSVSGNYLRVSGFEICFSNWIGMAVSGKNCAISKINSHHNRENGIFVSGDNNIVENSHVWQNCYSNVNGSNTRNGWAAGLSAARHPNNVILRGNRIYMNWGEGLSTYEANGTLLENNIVYDNFTNVYISDATNIIARGNLVYRSPDSQMVDAAGNGSHVGIMLGDEKYRPPSSNIVIVNNFLYGNRQNIYWWQGNEGGGMVNVLIANNTLANAYEGAGIEVHSGPHSDVRILNNIVVQDNQQPVIALYSLENIALGHNLWSKAPPGYALFSSDIVGDPRLVRNNFTTPDWFKLQDASPAIGKASKLSEVKTDFFGTPRDAVPDIGGHEYTNRSTNRVRNK